MEKDARSLVAESILSRIFSNVPFGFAARLWDGTEISMGGKREPFTLVFRSPATFRRLMLRPSTLRFAEAFISGDLEVEGDILAAVRLASRIETLRLGFRDRAVIAAGLLRIR